MNASEHQKRYKRALKRLRDAHEQAGVLRVELEDLEYEFEDIVQSIEDDYWGEGRDIPKSLRKVIEQAGNISLYQAVQAADDVDNYLGEQ